MPGPNSKHQRRGSPSQGNGANGDQTPQGSLAACMDCRNRKVKCNRELPRCATCKKAGIHCDYPSPEKRASQTKQLAEDVAAFNGRLSSIEKTLSTRMEMLTEIISKQAEGRRASLDDTTMSPIQPAPVRSVNLDDSDPDPEIGFGFRRVDSTDSMSRSSFIVTDGPGERYYGASSSYSHLVHARQAVERVLGEQAIAESPAQMSSTSSSRSTPSREQSLLAEVQQKYDSFALPKHFQEQVEGGDDKPLELPSRKALEEAAEFYLQDFTLEPPLFLRSTLMNAIAEQYRLKPSELDESWVLCFNNILLRCSTWKSKTFRPSGFSMNNIDDSLIPMLITNVYRALKHVERFSSLRIVSIQALFLLAVVSRDFIHFHVFEKIFDKACQLAKQMGLHERGTIGNNPSPQDVERQNLLWLLYATDKQRVFIKGSPCRIYLFECDIQLPHLNGENKQQLVVANLRLHCLIEEVYRHLYSPKANRQDPKARQQRLENLGGRVKALAKHTQQFCTAADQSSAAERAMALQLQYGFLITKLLIYSRGTDPQHKDVCLNSARSALQIMQKLSGGSFIFNGGVVILERFFCNYSIIAFYEVFEHVLEDNSPSAASDIALLGTTANALRLLSHPDRPLAYCTRLHKNLTWCNEVANLIHNHHSRPSSSAGASPRSIQSPVTRPKVFDQRNLSAQTSHPSESSFPTTTTHSLATSASQTDIDGDLNMDLDQPSSNLFGSTFPSNQSLHTTFDASAFPATSESYNFPQTLSSDMLGMDDLGTFTGANLNEDLISPHDIARGETGFQQGLGTFDMNCGLDMGGFSMEMGGNMQFGGEGQFAV